jgi:hypothetical protein
MKKALLVLVVALVVAVATTQSAYADRSWGWKWNNNDAEISRHNAMHGRQNLHPNRYYYSNGHYYPTNVNVKEQERWEGNKGERSFEQSPNLKAKLIDAGTILGSLFIIFR